MKKKHLLGVIAVSFLVLTSGCGLFANGDGKAGTSNITIEKDKAKELKLELNMGVGELTIEKGSAEWVEGTIDYSKKLKPEVSYKLKGDKGIGVIDQGNGKLDNFNLGEEKNKWSINLNDEIPTDLTVNSGASETNLDLKGLILSGLEVNAGVGDITIDLGGNWTESFDVSLEMGVGKTTVILPKEVGVKIESSKGIGTAEFGDLLSKGDGVYVNEAYEDADVIINLTTDLGIGEVVFK
ncbi:toast rack family protein [Neobacillus sp. FSL H8-0543]|uniref:toast rack family protein n=1 Tax=Neobacillus sp. FSL H8-0543 TaxID=2954672 RepID=UPI003158DF7A